MTLWRLTDPPADKYMDDDINRRHTSTSIWHLNGIPWNEAGLPPRLHRCRPQTKALLDYRSIHRCRCGALRYGSGRPWIEKNQTRKWRKRKALSGPPPQAR